MIIREWRAGASLTQAEAYPSHFRTKVVPDLNLFSGIAARIYAGAVSALVSPRRPVLVGISAIAYSSFDRSASS